MRKWRCARSSSTLYQKEGRTTEERIPADQRKKDVSSSKSAIGGANTPKQKYPIMIAYLQELTKDTIPLVRVSAYEILTLIAVDLPKEDVKHKLIGMVLSQFKTETDSEVKIELLRSLTSCGIRLGAELFAIVTNSDIQMLMKEKSWRVRREVFNMIADVSINAKSNQLFEVHFQEFFLMYLTDPVYQIRMHGNSLLQRILEIEPISWVTNVLIPRIQKLRISDPSYLKRITGIYAYEKLVSIYPKDLLAPCVSEVVAELKEKVPNVRIVALKTLITAMHVSDDQFKQSIKSSVSPLTTDSDIDVRSLSQYILKL